MIDPNYMSQIQHDYASNAVIVYKLIEELKVGEAALLLFCVRCLCHQCYILTIKYLYDLAQAEARHGQTVSDLIKATTAGNLTLLSTNYPDINAEASLITRKNDDNDGITPMYEHIGKYRARYGI